MLQLLATTMINESRGMASSPSAASSPAPSTSASPGGKRSRDPEDEVYVDNLHSHKRYLSEIMASSLNGLTVGDSLPENLMESPARSESMFYLRDDMSLQYSPMSEDSDDSRYSETMGPTSESLPTSPVCSPHRTQRPLSIFSSIPVSTASSSSSSSSTMTSQSRQRSSDCSEGRFPSSPSDLCHSADLRRAALLRSVQMRTQPSGSSGFDLHFGPPIQESGSNAEVDDHGGLYMKSLGEERDYHLVDYPSILGMSSSEFDREKSSLSDIKCKEDRSGT